MYWSYNHAISIDLIYLSRREAKILINIHGDGDVLVPELPFLSNPCYCSSVYISLENEKTKKLDSRKGKKG